jgi:hypothetical protein
MAICVIAGVVQGMVWAFVAPGIPYQVLADGRYGGLPTTSTYHFVDVAVFALSGIAIGIVLAVGAWLARAARGWQLLVALVGGSLLGATIAWAIGAWMAPGTDPASVGATGAGSIVIAPPSTGTMLVVLAQPAFAAAVYTFLVAWNGHPDLGRSGAPGATDAGAEPHYAASLTDGPGKNPSAAARPRPYDGLPADRSAGPGAASDSAGAAEAVTP